jgi:uncharacterized protein YkwD
VHAEQRSGRLRWWPLVAVGVLMLVAGIAALAPIGQPFAPAAHAQGDCNVDSSKLPLDAEETAALAEVNEYRAANGKPALTYSAALTRIALWKSTDMANNRYDSHTDLPTGRAPDQRFVDCGYVTGTMSVAWGENIAGCYPDAASTVAQWQGSPEHNANLLDAEFLYAGVKRVEGSAPDGAPGLCWYWTMDFGTLSDAQVGFTSTSMGGGLTAPALFATAMDSQTILLQWQPVSGANGYGIYDGTDGVVLGPVGGSQYTIGNLTPHTYYCFTMYAYNNAATSGWSSWVCASTPGG